MQRFRFSLETALTLRVRQEEQARLAAAEQERRFQEAQRQMAELDRDLQRHQQHRAELQRAEVDIQLLSDADRYAASLARVCSQQSERVHAAARALQAARETLHQRRQEREALEKLRERRLAEHVREQHRQEQQALDEASILRWRSA